MYLVILSLHIIFIVTWFAGLFYIVRLFVYQVEARSKTEVERAVLESQYRLMAKRLWYGITWPSFVLTLILGSSLLYLNQGLLSMPFMHIKLAFVAGLISYHLVCHNMFLKLQRGTEKYTSNFFRIWNEVATLFLVAIVFLIKMKSNVDWVYGIAGFVLFGVLLMIAIKIYKRIREKK